MLSLVVAEEEVAVGLITMGKREAVRYMVVGVEAEVLVTQIQMGEMVARGGYIQ
jgi:hypothetical protein